MSSKKLIISFWTSIFLSSVLVFCKSNIWMLCLFVRLRKWHHIVGRCVSSCLTSAVVWLLLISSDATTNTVRREVSVRVHISVSHHHSPLYSLPVSPSFSLHLVRLLRIPGGLLQHGLPHDCLLGLREQRGDGGDASWGQTILSSSFTCWPFKMAKRGQETGSNSATYVHTWRPHAASLTLHENWCWSLMIIPTTPETCSSCLDRQPRQRVYTVLNGRDVPIISAEPIAVH